MSTRVSPDLEEIRSDRTLNVDARGLCELDQQKVELRLPDQEARRA
jgi:hypothetical protein